MKMDVRLTNSSHSVMPITVMEVTIRERDQRVIMDVPLFYCLLYLLALFLFLSLCLANDGGSRGSKLVVFRIDSR